MSNARPSPPGPRKSPLSQLADKLATGSRIQEKMSRQRAAPREPPRLNAFQLHYLNQVIPKYQTGPSFTAYDESLEAAYDWLHNFDQAMKNNA